MVKEPTGSGGEPSSPNFGVSAGVKARHLSCHQNCYNFCSLLRNIHADMRVISLKNLGSGLHLGVSGRACGRRRLISNGDMASKVVRPLDTIIMTQKMKKVAV